jgi:hypothetical protein
VGGVHRHNFEVTEDEVGDADFAEIAKRLVAEQCKGNREKARVAKRFTHLRGKFFWIATRRA